MFANVDSELVSVGVDYTWQLKILGSATPPASLLNRGCWRRQT